MIFATHNANLVINGDAELINILDMNADNHTTVLATTIESTSNRSKLLNLEGGREAFEKRDKRLLRKIH